MVFGKQHINIPSGREVKVNDLIFNVNNYLYKVTAVGTTYVTCTYLNAVEPSSYLVSATVVEADNSLSIIDNEGNETYFAPVHTSLDLDGDMAVTYDSDEGATIIYNGSLDGETLSVTERLPIIPGDGVTIDANAGNDAIIIKADDGVMATKTYVDNGLSGKISKFTGSYTEGNVPYIDFDGYLADSDIGVYDLQPKMAVETTLPRDYILRANTYYALGELTTSSSILSFNKVTPLAGDEIYITFNSGASNYSLSTFMSGLMYGSFPVTSANKHYEISLHYDGNTWSSLWVEQ